MTARTMKMMSRIITSLVVICFLAISFAYAEESDKERLLKKWEKLTPEQRKGLKNKYRDKWLRMSESEKEELVKKYKYFSELPEKEQQTRKEKYRKLKSLPDEKRRELKERLKKQLKHKLENREQKNRRKELKELKRRELKHKNKK